MARYCAMEFDSEVLVNKAPTLQLANGKTATFMTQYDTKLSYSQ